MSTGLHKDLEIGEIHRIQCLEYADATARLAATGFTVKDVGRVAQQDSDSSFWLLVGYSPITWVLLGTDLSKDYLLLSFNWASVGSSPVLIGTVPAGAMIPEVVLIINTPFNQPTTLEVGRLAAPAELMLGSDNNPAIAGSYQVTPDMLYASATNVYLTLIAGSPPSTGSGQVIVYL